PRTVRRRPRRLSRCPIQSAPYARASSGCSLQSWSLRKPGCWKATRPRRISRRPMPRPEATPSWCPAIGDLLSPSEHHSQPRAEAPAAVPSREAHAHTVARETTRRRAIAHGHQPRTEKDMHAQFHVRKQSCLLTTLLALVPASAQGQTSAPEPAAQPAGKVTIPPVVVTAPPKPKSAARKQPPAGAPAAPQLLPAAVTRPQLPGQQIAPGLPAQAAGQTVTTIDRDRMTETRAFTIGDVLQESPGVSIKQGNGPRDMGISIRGSNARNGFGVRNVQ